MASEERQSSRAALKGFRMKRHIPGNPGQASPLDCFASLAMTE